MGSPCCCVGIFPGLLSLMQVLHDVKKECCLACSCVLSNEQANQKQLGDLYEVLFYTSMQVNLFI